MVCLTILVLCWKTLNFGSCLGWGEREVKTMDPVLGKERINWEEVRESSLNEPLLWGSGEPWGWGALEKKLGGPTATPLGTH